MFVGNVMNVFYKSKNCVWTWALAAEGGTAPLDFHTWYRYSR